MTELGPTSLLLLSLGLLALGVKVWALADAARQHAAAFPAAGKLTKPAWVGILAAALLLGYFLNGLSVLGLFNLVGTVAAIVYLVDVRPAVSGLRPGSGPYGPY